MRRSVAVIAFVALAATAGGGLAQGDGARDERLARDVETSAMTSASALGGAPRATGWSDAGAYWDGDEPKDLSRSDATSGDIYDAVVALSAVPYRQCFVVVKDGAVAHESYDERRGVDAETALRTDSVGIIATVALVGAATQRGLFRLDQPIAGYGVRGMQERFGAYAGLVTAHHLLSQTHGGGEVPPGETFRRDDDPKFLATLFELIEKTAGVSVREFARVALVEPLGLSSGSLFGETSGDGDDGATKRRDVEAAYGRDLSLTCRDVATIAQLFLNGGVWRDATPPRVNRQIVSSRFAREAFSPRAHFPRLNRAFGLGAWAHDPEPFDEPLSSESSKSRCCAPVTGMRACGESAAPLLGPLLGDARRGGPAERVGVFLGDEGSAVFVLPDTKTALVSLGRTVAGSDACHVGLERATALAGVGGRLGENRGALGGDTSTKNPRPRRDDYALLKVLWAAVRPATKSGGDGYAARTGGARAGDGAYASDETGHVADADVSRSFRTTSSRRETTSDAASNAFDSPDVRGKSGSVRDLVVSAFRDSFAGTLGGPGGDPARGPAAYVPGVGSGAFGGSSGAAAGGRVDAEVRRLTAARANWYADAEMKLTAEDRERRADYDAKLDALEKTQKKYKAAYEQAKLEIVAAAEEERRAEARERDADAARSAARWQTNAVLAQQKAQQERLERREREVKLAQEAYAEALTEARAARAAARGERADEPDESDDVGDFGDVDDVDDVEIAAEDAESATSGFFATRRDAAGRGEKSSSRAKRAETTSSPPRRASGEAENHERSRSARPSNAKKRSRAKTSVVRAKARADEKEKKDSGDAAAPVFSLDVNDLDFKASGLLDAVDAVDASSSIDDSKPTPRRGSDGDDASDSKRRGEAKTPEKTRTFSRSSTTPVSPASRGDVRAVLPASDATAASADDFLSALSPSATARVSARLGALRDIDAALERALDDDLDDETGDATHGFVGGAVSDGVSRASAGDGRQPGTIGSRIDSAYVPRSKKAIAALGTSVWDAVRTFFGRSEATEAQATVGSCLCACPGGGGGAAADACFDIDLSVAADADGPAACARLARGANADVCAATGVVRLCEERQGVNSRDASTDALSTPTREKRSEKRSASSSSSSSKRSSSKKRSGSEKAVKKKASSGKTAALGDAPTDFFARPLRSRELLGSVRTVGAYECVKTAQCPSPAAGLGDAFSFPVDAYECDAVSFAQCRWAPATRCPALVKSPGGSSVLGANRVPDRFADATTDAFVSASAAAPRDDANGATRRMESFALGALAALAATAAIATAKSRRARSRSAFRELASSDEERAIPVKIDGGVSSNATPAEPSSRAPRRGFGVDPDALTRGVWRALGGVEESAAEREPLLAKSGSVDRAARTPEAARETHAAEGSNNSATRLPRSPAPTRARRKVVFDVEVDAPAEDGAGDVERGAALEAEGDPEARAVAAAERAAAAARAARLARAAKAREDAEARAARTRAEKAETRFVSGAKREARAKPVGELSREELLERAHGALPRRANAANGTGIPGA